MVLVKLEPRCPQSAQGIALDPQPDWSFDALLAELNSLEGRLSVSSVVPQPYTKTKPREVLVDVGNEIDRKPFVVPIDDKFHRIRSDDKNADDQSSASARRFSCGELYLSESSESDDSDEGINKKAEANFMVKMRFVESALLELTHEHHLGVKEDIRNRVADLEADLISEYENSISTLVQVEKYRDARLEMDQKLDTLYQRKIAEALDSHLTAVQRDHELKSQIEEKRIKTDAAYEEAKRKEKALQQEKLRQEKAKIEAEAREKMAEKTRIAALEAERKAANEAAKREVAEMSKRGASEKEKKEEVQQKTSFSTGILSTLHGGSNSDGVKSNMVKIADSALKLEKGRQQKLKELDRANQELRFSDADISHYGNQIARWLRQVSGTRDKIRTVADQLINILGDPRFPQSVKVVTFAEKVVFNCERPIFLPFACSHVIARVTLQVPHTLDIFLAKLHEACIYTVPKHIIYSERRFESMEAYLKVIGYREIDRKIESTQSYLTRLESYMKLYGALIQTQSEDLRECWAWLARFLNALPPNIYTAVALNAFLTVAGFALFERYKYHFEKLLAVISDYFLEPLKGRKKPEMTKVVTEIQTYINDKIYLKEPEGRVVLQGSLLSRAMAPDRIP